MQRRWALFASIAFQLSGMTIWLLGVYVSGLSLMLFYLILLALIWTSARRTSLANYLLWSVATTLMLMAGDIALSCYALLAAGILFLYRDAIAVWHRTDNRSARVIHSKLTNGVGDLQYSPVSDSRCPADIVS